MTVDHDEARGAQSRETIADFRTYQEAERAVDWLSDRGFAVDRVSIVGTGIAIIEKVTGRLTTARAALNGAAQGALIALLFSLLLGIFFTVAEGFWALLLTALVIGVVFGALFAAAIHASRGGGRDFASTSGISADRFEVQADADVAAEARLLLSEMPPPQRDREAGALRAA